MFIKQMSYGIIIEFDEIVEFDEEDEFDDDMNRCIQNQKHHQHVPYIDTDIVTKISSSSVSLLTRNLDTRITNNAIDTIHVLLHNQTKKIINKLSSSCNSKTIREEDVKRVFDLYDRHVIYHKK